MQKILMIIGGQLWVTPRKTNGSEEHKIKWNLKNWGALPDVSVFYELREKTKPGW